MEYGYNGDPDVIIRGNNPFLDMLAAVEEDDAQSTVSSYLSEASNASAHRFTLASENKGPKNFKLPEFWPHAPDLWFCRAEFRFEVAGVNSEREKFAHVVDALNYDSLKLVKDLMVNPPFYKPYMALKARLLLATQLTPIQMAEKLMKEAELGDRRPSQLLASMLEFCPTGEENTALFRAAFLMRLPASIRGHLDGLELKDLKDLAATADRHWSNQAGQPNSVYAVTADQDEPEETVAAISGQKKKKPFKRTGGETGNKWSQLVKVTMCARHQRFGADCRKCGDPANCEYERMAAGN